MQKVFTNENMAHKWCRQHKNDVEKVRQCAVKNGVLVEYERTPKNNKCVNYWHEVIE